MSLLPSDQPPASEHLPTLWKLALPALFEQLLSFCIGLFDTWLAGRIGSDASAAVGLASYVDWLATLLFLSVGIGTSAIVARHWGAKEESQARLAASQALPLAICIGLFSGTIIYTCAPGFAQLQGLSRMSDNTHSIGVLYLRLSAVSHCFSATVFAGNAALRGSGDMKSPMLILGLMNIVNAVVSSALVFGWGVPAIGPQGIVLGTVAARIAGAVFMILRMSCFSSGIRWELSGMIPQRDWGFRLLRIGLPALIDGILTWVGHFLFIMVIAHLASGELGRAYYATHMVGINIEALTYLPAVAWGIASASLIGQTLGAGLPERAWQIGHRAALQCAILTLCPTLFYYFASESIFRWMHLDPLVRSIGPPALRYLALYQIPLAILIVYTHALRGAGDTRFPMLLTILGTLMIRVPMAYLCGIVWQEGLIGAWTGMMLDVTFRAVLASIRYYRGSWMHLKV